MRVGGSGGEEAPGRATGTVTPRLLVRLSGDPAARRAAPTSLARYGGEAVVDVLGPADLARPFEAGLPVWWRPRTAAAAADLGRAAPRLADCDGLRVVSPEAWLPCGVAIAGWIVDGASDRSDASRGSRCRRRPDARWVEASLPALAALPPRPAPSGDPPPAFVAVTDPHEDPIAVCLALARAAVREAPFGLALPFEASEAARYGHLLLNVLELRPHGVQVVACPTCGRCRVPVAAMAAAVEERLAGVTKPLLVAVMGCEVNGPGEARHADCGLAGGRDGGVLFRRGERLGRRPLEEIVEALAELVEAMAADPAVPGRPPRPWPPAPAIDRPPVRLVRVGPVALGAGHPVSLQSMTSTLTPDVTATSEQIARLAAAGCEIVRVAVPDDASVAALPALRRGSPMPVVADVHFSARLAKAAVEAGADKLRINPGNIGGPDALAPILEAARHRGVPIRIGVNAGSLAPEILARHGGPTAEAVADSALGFVRAFEGAGFRDLVVSVKSSSVRDTVGAYRLVGAQAPYPLHVGVTEAGLGARGTIGSAVGIGLLLLEGLGETIRVSLTGDPVDEIGVGRRILEAVGRLGPGSQGT